MGKRGKKKKIKVRGPLTCERENTTEQYLSAGLGQWLPSCRFQQREIVNEMEVQGDERAFLSRT